MKKEFTMLGHSTDLWGCPPSKRCNKCRRHLPLESFHTKIKPNGRRWRQSWCKECLVQNGKEYRADPANRAALNRTWRKAKLKGTYGLTVAEYDAMFAAQAGLCAICGQPETKRGIKH